MQTQFKRKGREVHAKSAKIERQLCALCEKTLRPLRFKNNR